MKLVLGTVQFGLAYGVANPAGQVPEREAARILTRFRAAGGRMLDTAEAYGEAEAVLGRLGVEGFQVVGKLGRIEAEPAGIEAEVRARLAGSLSRLGVSHLHGLLLHAPDQLHDDPARGRAILATLEALRAEGLVGGIGFSAYDPGQTGRLLDLMRPDLVQIPLCPLDARWDDSGVLARLAGVQLHVRSVWLQGLILMETLPAWARPWRGLVADWQGWAKGHGVTPAAAALALTAQREDIARLVIGVLSVGQLDEALAALPLRLPPLPDRLKTGDERFLDPRGWGNVGK